MLLLFLHHPHDPAVSFFSFLVSFSLYIIASHTARNTKCTFSPSSSNTSELWWLSMSIQPTDLCDRHPWSHVVIGMWRKYPNPKCTHVVSVDVIDRSVDPETGIIRTERILGCKQKAPRWVVKVRNTSCFPQFPADPSPIAVWRLRRRLRTGSLLRGPRNPGCQHHLCKPLPIPVCYLLRSCSLYARRPPPDKLQPDGRGSGPDETVANSCERT